MKVVSLFMDQVLAMDGDVGAFSFSITLVPGKHEKKMMAQPPPNTNIVSLVAMKSILVTLTPLAEESPSVPVLVGEVFLRMRWVLKSGEQALKPRIPLVNLIHA